MKLPLLLAYKFILKTDQKDISIMIKICFFSILIGTFSLALVAAIMNGFEKATHEKLQGIHADILIRADMDSSLDYEKLSNVLKSEFANEVSDLAPTSVHQLIIRNDKDDKSRLVAIKAIDPEKDIIKIAIGSDHRGFEFKEYIKNSAEHPSRLIVWNDVGAYTGERSDYPEFAIAAAKLFLNKEVECAVLLCGTGIGMAIASNRYKGIYAGVAFTEAVARSAKEDDNVNFLVLPADYLTDLETVACVNTWLRVQFKGDRYEKRIKMIDAIK